MRVNLVYFQDQLVGVLIYIKIINKPWKHLECIRYKNTVGVKNHNERYKVKYVYARM